MTATVFNGQATAPVVTLPQQVSIGIGNATISANAKPNAKNTGIKYLAKVRSFFAEDDARTDQEILISAASKATFEGEPLPLGSKHVDAAGNVVPGLGAPRLNKDGSVRSPGLPQVTLYKVTNLGDGEGIKYQVLVKLNIGKNAQGRYLQVQVDVVQRPNEFRAEGEISGEMGV